MCAGDETCISPVAFKEVFHEVGCVVLDRRHVFLALVVAFLDMALCVVFAFGVSAF